MRSNIPDWETGAFVKEEEFVRAEALALFDYLRKSRSHGFVVSLSGGADSAATASLVHLMVAFGLRELGAEKFGARLSYIFKTIPDGDAKAITAKLLTTAYQSCDNSGSVTREAARVVAGALGACHYEWDVGQIVRDYIQIIGRATGTQFNWHDHDIPLQNIQARARSPVFGCWRISKMLFCLPPATARKRRWGMRPWTATPAGDSVRLRVSTRPGCGNGCAGLKQPAPRVCIRLRPWTWSTGKPPRQNCVPPDCKQTDEDDLMPYDVLDAIERAAIRDKRSPVEVFEILLLRYPRHDPKQLNIWVARFFKLWCRNQWKRERYAPSFHLDDENLDPKTWCRFPILSGGFEVELQELSKRANQAEP